MAWTFDLRPFSERRELLQAILPKAGIVSEALSVGGRGCELFELICAHDLEGIVAKRLADPYEPRVRWLKVKNPDYSQKEGRGDFFNTPPRPRRFGIGAPAGLRRGRMSGEGSTEVDFIVECEWLRR